jgi:hypothetical protein
MDIFYILHKNKFFVTPQFLEYLCMKYRFNSLDVLFSIIENHINTTKNRLTQKTLYNILKNFKIDKKILVFFLLNGCEITREVFVISLDFQKEEIIGFLYKKEYLDSNIFNMLCKNEYITEKYLLELIMDGYKLDLDNLKMAALYKNIIFRDIGNIELDDEFYWICAKKSLYIDYLDKKKIFKIVCKVQKFTNKNKKYFKTLIGDNKPDQECMLNAQFFTNTWRQKISHFLVTKNRLIVFKEKTDIPFLHILYLQIIFSINLFIIFFLHAIS